VVTVGGLLVGSHLGGSKRIGYVIPAIASEYSHIPERLGTGWVETRLFRGASDASGESKSSSSDDDRMTSPGLKSGLFNPVCNYGFLHDHHSI
jgi:hypothetical protein